jgi:aldose 1-epimerase
MTAREREQCATGLWELEVEPARGGAVTLLRHRGRDVLTSWDLTRDDAMGAANFALVPYANRIADGMLRAGNRQWRLPRNFGEHPHPLHGTGWLNAWTLTQRVAQGVDLTLVHQPDAAWPWPFTAKQRIRIRDDGVRFELAVTNDADEPAPLGVGFHPAFAAHAHTRLHTALHGVWVIDEESLPLLREPAGVVLPEVGGAVPVLRDALVDHCFTGWQRTLRLESAGTEGNIAWVNLTASAGLDYLHLYMPPGRRWFCAEPMSQMPDAVHHGSESDHGGWRVLAPHTTLAVWMHIDAATA